MTSLGADILRVGRKALFLLACCVLVMSAIETRAELSTKQARKLITRMAGAELPSDSVRIKNVSSAADGSAEVTAEIKTVFRFEKNKAGVWRVREVRIGPERWLQINQIANALNTKVSMEECLAPDPPFKGSKVVDPSVKRSRCLLASLLGVELPSDAVRIQEVSPFAIPVGSEPSVLVVALITVQARVVSDGGKARRVTELRTGNRDWVQLDPLIAALEKERQEQARGELALMAEALERFRKDRGTYVVTDSQAVAMDHLNPRYIARVIRIDPWQRPYKYQGERERFTLRSAGPDGKDGTPDDIEIMPSH